MNRRRKFWPLVFVGAAVIVIALVGLAIQSRRITQSIAEAKSICAQMPQDSTRPDVEKFL